ncbi:hypothetical protein AQI95_37545 [Streptomyces yokosukanensis]|uniref:Secreted protein n=1 Tax=Streptomyces yokosukanensis TaxID=67386 RepID=A0A101NUP7_9ACTN|nr:hypothetical protein [Streptomyces yokosukanensis]KUM99675.1 hypothetical protein AQI95_37545 [Streptomyces yokosukanensis]
MGGLPVRRIACTTLCAALLAGVTGPAAVAADSTRERVHAASHAPVPGADALLVQIQLLANLGIVLTPVTNLLNAVLKADNGQLPTDQATSLVQAAKDAIAKVTAAAPAAGPLSPHTKPAPGWHSSPTTSDGKSLAADAAARADLASDALANLTKALDTLLKAVTSGNASQVVPAVTGVLTGLVNYLAAVLLSGGLPAPNLPGLPALPSLPGLPTV